MSDKMRESFDATIERCGDAEKFIGNLQLKTGCLAYFIHGWQAALSQSEPQVSQPVANNLLTQLLDSVEGNCYMGKEWELDTCKSLRKISPPDYEALKAQLVRSEADNTRLQSQYDEMRLKCSRRPAVAENEALKAENVRLQSECDRLKEELNAWKIGFGSKAK